MENMEVRRPRQSTPIPTGRPWLVFPCGKNRRNQTFCTISPSSTNTIGSIVELKTIPELRKAEFRAFHHGWLLFTTEDDDHSWTFWNPTTYESVKLPPTNKKMVDSCIFTASPKNPQCKVLLLSYDDTSMSYSQPGDQEWSTYDYREKIMKGDSLNYLACLDGIIYAKTSVSHLFSIEFETGTGIILKCVVSEGPSGKFGGRLLSFFFESLGELFSVQIFTDRNTVFGVEIFKWNLSQKVWLQVERLDDRLIFLGSQWNPSSCSCLTADTSIRGNRIYFMMPNKDLLYMYDLEEQRVLTSVCCPKLQTPWYEPFWMMPTYPEMNLSQNKISKAVEKSQTTTESIVESHKDTDVSVYEYPHIDILTKIAKHLKPLDYLNFRSTSNLFRSAAPTTQWSINCITSEIESPWLVTFSYDKNVFRFTDPKYNNTYHMKVPESLLGTHIIGSKDGYLLMVEDENYYYFNPFAGSHVKLPSPTFADGRLSFSSSPSSPGCLVVHIYVTDCSRYGYLTESDVDYLLPGSYWNNESLGHVSGDFVMNGVGVFHKEVFYYLGQGGNLGVLKGDDTNGFSFKVLEKPNVPVNAFYHNYLMECNEELMAIFVGRNGNWVEVFKLDHSNMRWLRVRNLGNYTMFVSNPSSIATVARSREMENKIYFPRFYNERIIYYSLETEKFHTHGDNAVLNNFVDTKEQLYCTWIEPNCVDTKEQISLNWS